MEVHERLADYDSELRRRYDGEILVGVDEVGRGAWSGPFVAAAVALGPDVNLPFLNDSKKLAASRRETLYDLVIEKSQAYAIICVEPAYIDTQGLTAANIKAMEEAAVSVRDQLGNSPVALYIVDQAPCFSPTPHLMLPKADATSQCVAAASVLAKVHRDRLMADLGVLYPAYGWADNKGYINAHHKEAVLAHGLTEHHRKSYRVSGINAPKQISLLDL